MTSPTCSNCQAELAGPYCSACGQEHLDREPTLRQVLADAWEEIVKVDGRVLATLKTLFLAPGKLTLEFFEGRRVRYVTPLKLYLTCSAAYFLVANFSDLQVKIQQNGITVSEERMKGSSGQMILTIIRESTAFFFNHLATIYIVIVPLTALATAALFAGRKRTLLFHLVFVLHVWSALFVVGALVNVAHIRVNFFLFFLVAGFTYVLFAARRTFSAKWFEATIKAFLFGVGTFFVSLMALIAIVVCFALQKKAQTGVSIAAEPPGVSAPSAK
jgi:hypothetical protein